MSSPNEYQQGQLVTLTGAFALAGAAQDPTTITLKIKDPTGVITTYTYALSQLTRTGLGVYTYNLLITMPGKYWYRFIGTGLVTAAAELSLDAATLMTQ